MTMLDLEKSLLIVQEKLENLLNNNIDTKENISTLLLNLQDLSNRINQLEKFDIKRIEKLETCVEILKDRLNTLEHRGSPVVQQIIKRHDDVKEQFAELKTKITFIEDYLKDKNSYRQSILLTIFSICGTLISTLISGLILYKMKG